MAGTSALLGPVADLNVFLANTTPPTVSLPLTFCLHAARVSLAYRGIRAKTRASAAGIDGQKEAQRNGWLGDVAGFLVMAWGGSFLTAYLSQGGVPNQLLTLSPFLTYVTIHVYVTLLVQAVPVSAVLLDTVLPLIDGATRCAAIAAGVKLAANHPTPAVRGSLVFQILLGTIAACGGGQLAATLGVFNPDVKGWQLSTPPILRARNFAEASDVIAALAGAVTFSCFSGSHPAWPLVAAKVAPYFGASRFFTAARLASWSEAEARALTTVVVAAVFAARAVVLHWTVKSPKSEGQRLEVEAAKQSKRAGKSPKNITASGGKSGTPVKTPVLAATN